MCANPRKRIYISRNIQQQPLSYTNYTKSSSLHFEFVLTIVCYISGDIFCFDEAPLSNCTAVDQPFTVRGTGFVCTFNCQVLRGRGGCSQGFEIAPKFLECSKDFGVAPRGLK